MARSYTNRQQVIVAMIIAVFVIFAIRLFYLQVIDRSYRVSAENNAFRKIVQYPARGLIYDRNGKLMVYNEAVYDLMIIPSQLKEMDTLELCSLLSIPIEDARKKMSKARAYSRYAPSLFEKQISKEVCGKLIERLYRFPGFYVQARTLRKYPYPIAAHVLGYIGEVDDKMIRNDAYYAMGDYIGMSGLEKQYEVFLRGQKGIRIQMVDVRNREMGSYQDGRFDTASVAGESMYSTLDLELQAYAESLMANKRGSFVAIEPETGEILALVSSPSYDPNLLVGRVRANNYRKLLMDPLKPLFDRSLMALYPPGSTFKTPQALIALHQGVITQNTGFHCDRSLVGCHNHPDAYDIKSALKMSCNPYFYQVFRRLIEQKKESNRFKDSRLGLDRWEDDMRAFGFGVRLDVDLPNVKAGLIPNVEFYDRRYGREQWAFSTIRSVAIGQGEVGIIPLQLANLAVIIANKGYYITPHLCRHIGDSAVGKTFKNKPHQTHIAPEHFIPIIDGMYEAVHEPGGTASRARIDSIAVCGKTGTSENPPRKDHSVFICFAPMDKPKIAVSVFIENAGFGGIWAAPIASLAIEYYINRKVKRTDLEKQIKDANFLNSK